MAAEARAASIAFTVDPDDLDDDEEDAGAPDPSLAHLSPLELEIHRQIMADEEVAEQSRDAKLLEKGKAALASLPQYKPLQAHEVITQADFLEWVPEYTGERFDVLHLDFPYGIDYSGNRGRATGTSLYAPTYTDSKDLYWALVNTLLEHHQRLVLPVAHVIFWFDMRYYQDTVNAFTEAGFKLVAENPLIWDKGHEGIASDYKRRFRHCYETALFFSLGDRQINKLVPDIFTFSSGKREKVHISEKPREVLSHFLSAVVDRHTSVLDPTCGSGNALAAAHTLGAVSVRGMDIAQENVEVARSRLTEALSLPRLTDAPTPPVHLNIEDDL